jgi:hypothetical protein
MNRESNELKMIAKDLRSLSRVALWNPIRYQLKDGTDLKLIVNIGGGGFEDYSKMTKRMADSFSALEEKGKEIKKFLDARYYVLKRAMVGEVQFDDFNNELFLKIEAPQSLSNDISFEKFIGVQI